MSSGILPSLIHAHFFFVDIVGLSDPRMPTKVQIKKLNVLNRSIADCAAFKSTPKDTKLLLPTGDGMAIGFLQGPELPVRLAIELHQIIRKYNKGKMHIESIGVRIGIHDGSVFIVNDVYGNANIWGPGIILARRIMDLGDEDHILLSSHIAEELITISDEYRQYFHNLGYFNFKHDVRMKIYSAYLQDSGKNFGSIKRPTKMMPTERKFLYSYIEVNLSFRGSPESLVRHRRIYEIQNLSDEPLSSVWHQIATDVERGFDELKIKVYDEDHRDLAITKITVDKDEQKEFYTAFVRPLPKGDRKRYTLEYEVEEPKRYFENAFFTDCERFVVNLDYPEDLLGFKNPKAYEVDMETEKKKKHKIQPIVSRKSKGRLVARWSHENISKGQSFRFEW